MNSTVVLVSILNEYHKSIINLGRPANKTTILIKECSD